MIFIYLLTIFSFYFNSKCCKCYPEHKDDNELTSKNNSKKQKENDKKIDENKLPDKLISRESLYKWSGDYCGIQCCCYFLATLLYNEDEILKEFADSNIKFLNNIAQIVNDFKNNNYNNNCHELLFNSICDLFFEIAESLTQEDLNLIKKNEDEVDEKSKERYIIVDYFFTIGFDLIKFISDYKINYNGKNKFFSEILTLYDLDIIKKHIPDLKNYYNSKNISHDVSPYINDFILCLLSYYNKHINFKNENLLVMNNNKFEIIDEFKNNINLIYSFYNVKYGSIGHGCCFYYNFKDKKYYFVSNENEIEVPLEYIINPEISEENKINLLFKKINEQKIINYDYKFETEIKYIYKL